jgi:hypothetical protein
VFSDPSRARHREFRPIIVEGHKSTGKTTFAVSASRHAPDDLTKIPKKAVACNDAILLSFDKDGEDGAVAYGLVPRVVHFNGCVGWTEQKNKLIDAVQFIKPMVDAGEISVVGFDLGAVDAAIQSWITGEDSTQLRNPIGRPDNAEKKKPNWQRVTAEGLWLFHHLSQLNCTVVAMTHLKARDYNAFADDLSESKKAKKAVADASMSLSGLVTDQMSDVCKGMLKPWVHHTSFQLVCAVQKIYAGDPLNPSVVRKHVVYTEGDDLVDAGTRFRGQLPKEWTGSLNAMLRKCYGSAYNQETKV